MKRYIIILLVILSFASRATAQEMIDLTPEQKAQLKHIEEQTSEIRGLPFKTPVRYVVMKKTDLIQYIAKKFREEATAEEFHNKSIAYQMLGLFPKGFDYEKEMLELLGEQVGAFYDHDTKALTTFSDQQMSDLFQLPLYAHELVHALQDQHYNFSSYPEMTMKDNDDRQRAFQSLFEGDATLIMDPILRRNLKINNPVDMLKQIAEVMKTQNTEKLDLAPPFIRDTLIFSYTGGKDFVQALYNKTNSYELVDKAYKDLPTSTEQILHPEKYIDPAKRDNAKDIKALQISSNNWKMIDNNTLGELGIRLLFATVFTPPRQPKPKPAGNEPAGIMGIMGKAMEAINAMKPTPVPPEGIEAAQGWGGDRYQVFAYKPKNNSGTEQTALVWNTVWDSEEDAFEFAEMMSRTYQKRYPDFTVKEERINGRKVMVMENSEWRVTLAREGDKVRVLHAPPALFKEFADLISKAK